MWFCPPRSPCSSPSCASTVLAVGPAGRRSSTLRWWFCGSSSLSPSSSSCTCSGCRGRCPASTGRWRWGTASFHISVIQTCRLSTCLSLYGLTSAFLLSCRTDLTVWSAELHNRNVRDVSPPTYTCRVKLERKEASAASCQERAVKMHFLLLLHLF